MEKDGIIRANVNTETRIDQLRTALKVIDGALKRFNGQNQEEIVILATQIRALICKGGTNFHPLLLELASESKIPMECYGPYSISKGSSVLKEAINLHRFRIVSLEQYFPRAVRYSLSDWLDSEIIILKKETYTPNEILRMKSDSEASHYDPTIKQKLENLKKIERHEGNTKISEPDYYILETARIVSHFANLVVETLTKK